MLIRGGKMRRICKLIFSVTASLMAPVVFSNPTFESKGDGWTLSAGLYLITQNIEADSIPKLPQGARFSENLLDSRQGTYL
ncbi:hypothetical protein PBPRB1806 [Photobacterium profundum SS9]|uniref:Uncharacterized protein n=2 Tax=Photobacterium profundum TaxID=74109 RepID=Q6LGB6_PHOPR|nr:hypothetical protein PBPRB1806 [Photobacterium profundum SS9]